MPIQILLTNRTVTIYPMSFEVGFGNNQVVGWQPHDNSQRYDFDTPAITFDSASAPFSVQQPNGSSVSAADNNGNESGQPVAYSYQVHLVDANGNKITYPPNLDKSETNKPVITNKPR